MEPINFKYVTYKKIDSIENGETKKLTVLVLDEEANSKYWRLINSFPLFIAEIQLEKSEDANEWHISIGFSELDGFADIMNDPYIAQVEPELLYKIPVSYVEDDRVFCVLELANGKLVENELWK